MKQNMRKLKFNLLVGILILLINTITVPQELGGQPDGISTPKCWQQSASNGDGKNDKSPLTGNGVYFYVIEANTNERAVRKAAILR